MGSDDIDDVAISQRGRGRSPDILPRVARSFPNRSGYYGLGLSLSSCPSMFGITFFFFFYTALSILSWMFPGNCDWATELVGLAS